MFPLLFSIAVEKGKQDADLKINGSKAKYILVA